MSDFTVDRDLSAAEEQNIARDVDYVVLRGASEGTVHVSKGSFQTLIGEAALIALKEEFSGAVYRSPDADFQSSYDHLVVGFKNDVDAKRYATTVDRMKQATKPRSHSR